MTCSFAYPASVGPEACAGAVMPNTSGSTAIEPDARIIERIELADRPVVVRKGVTGAGRAALRYHQATMPRLAANLSYLFTERPFLDRFGAAAGCGFRAIEHQFPYREASESAIRERLRAHDLRAVLFNLPPGEEGERGLGGLPGREAEFREGLNLALRYCRATGCPRLHAMWGVPGAQTSLEESWATFVANLREAAPRAAEAGVILLVEPLNPRDNPGYPLNRQADAHALAAEVGAPNVKVQFDLYHCQIVEGDVAAKLKHWLGGPESNVGHIQIAGPPDRLEPDAGELNYAWLLPLIDELGYAGWVGCEYRPAAGTEAGLGWARPWGIRPPPGAGEAGSQR